MIGGKNRWGLYEPAEHIGSGLLDETGAVDARLTKMMREESVSSIVEHEIRLLPSSRTKIQWRLKDLFMNRSLCLQYQDVSSDWRDIDVFRFCSKAYRKRQLLRRIDAGIYTYAIACLFFFFSRNDSIQSLIRPEPVVYWWQASSKERKRNVNLKCLSFFSLYHSLDIHTDDSFVLSINSEIRTYAFIYTREQSLMLFSWQT